MDKRSISIRGKTHAKLRAFCKKHNVTMTGLVERLCVEFFAGRESTDKPVRGKTEPPASKEPIRGGGIHNL